MLYMKDYNVVIFHLFLLAEKDAKGFMQNWSILKGFIHSK